MRKEEKSVNKRLSLAVASVLLSLALAVPAAAAPSPKTSPAPVNPVVTAAKGYSLTKPEEQATSTTVGEAAKLAEGITVEVQDVVSGASGTVLGQSFANPASISEAKADLIKNTAVQSELSKLGIGTNGLATIAKSETIAWDNGAQGEIKTDITAEGLVPGEKVAFLVYVPGELQPRIITPTWLKNGKLRVQLPVPCTYHIVK